MGVIITWSVFLFAFAVQHSYKPGCQLAAHFELLKYIYRDIFMKKLLILTLFLTSSFFENKNAYADLKKGVYLDVSAAQPPAKPSAHAALFDWMQKESQGQAGRRSAYLRVLNILHKSLDIPAEFSAAVSSALKDPSVFMRVEGIWIVKYNWPALYQRFYDQLIHTAVRDNNPTVRMDALFALDQPDIVLNEQQKLLLAPALKDKSTSVRKKSYQILSAARHNSSLPLAVSQAIKKALAKEPYLKPTPVANQAFFNRMLDQHGSAAGVPADMRSWHIYKLKDVDRSDPGLSIITAKILQTEQSPMVLLSAVRLIKYSRLVNKETLEPLIQLLLRTKKDDIRKEIMWALANARLSWEERVFNSTAKVLFDMDIQTQGEAYYVLEKLLWQHPALQKNIQTIFKGGWEDFYVSKKLFHSSVKIRTAALWFLSQISEPLNSAVRKHAMDSLADPAVFNRFMALELIDVIPALNQNAAIQRLWLETAQKDPSPLIRAEALRRLLYFKQSVSNEVLVRFLLDIVSLDASPVVQAAAIGVLGQVDWSVQPAGVRKFFIDKMLEYLANVNAILQNASIWALGQAGPHADSKQQKLIQSEVAGFLTHVSLKTRRSALAALVKLNPDDPRILAAVAKAQSSMPPPPAAPPVEELTNPSRLSSDRPSGSCKNTFKNPA